MPSPQTILMGGVISATFSLKVRLGFTMETQRDGGALGDRSLDADDSAVPGAVTRGVGEQRPYAFDGGIDVAGDVVTLGHHRARILLLRGLCSTSAIPSASSTGGT